MLILLVWVGCGLLAAYWWLKLADGQPKISRLPYQSTSVEVDLAAVTKALGAASVAAPSVVTAAESTPGMRLAGVVAESPGGQGVALIAIDNLPARPFRVGDRVNERWDLHALTATQAHLRSVAEPRQELTLEMSTPGR